MSSTCKKDKVLSSTFRPKASLELLKVPIWALTSNSSQDSPPALGSLREF